MFFHRATTPFQGMPCCICPAAHEVIKLLKPSGQAAYGRRRRGSALTAFPAISRNRDMDSIVRVEDFVQHQEQEEDFPHHTSVKLQQDVLHFGQALLDRCCSRKHPQRPQFKCKQLSSSHSS